MTTPEIAAINLEIAKMAVAMIPMQSLTASGEKERNILFASHFEAIAKKVWSKE